MQKQQAEAQEDGGGAIRNCALLALPLLAAQRDMLALSKTYLKDENCLLPVQNFVLREVQAVMMVFDRSRKWRDLGPSVESSVADIWKDALPKMVSGSVALIEAQEAIVGTMIDALTKLKSPSAKANKDEGK